MPQTLRAGSKRLILWALPDEPISTSIFNSSGTVVSAYNLVSGDIEDFKGGRAEELNTLEFVKQWHNYQVYAGTEIVLPDPTLGFGNDPCVFCLGSGLPTLPAGFKFLVGNEDDFYLVGADGNFLVAPEADDLPALSPGFSYLTTAGGVYLVGPDGSYLINHP